MGMLNHQANVDPVTPMPTERMDDTSTVETSSAETVVWYYLSSSAWAAAAGQAAGTICVGKLTYTGVGNSLGSAVGTFADTSLTWGAATRVSTLVTAPEDVLSQMQFMSETDQVATITPYLATNGDYIVDHRRGQVWMKAKATVANDAATYLYQTPVTGGSTGDKVDIIKIGGVAVIADDGAYTAGTSTGFVAFGFADETSTDSVDEGDVGALRMTLNRRLITADLYQEDTAHTTADYGSQMLAIRNDGLATAYAGAANDYIPLSTCAKGALYVNGSAQGQAAASYTCGIFTMGGVVLDARPATDVIADNLEWGVTQMTQYGELRVRDDDANTDLDSIVTAVQLIDDAVYTDGSGTPSKGIAVMGTDGTNPQILSCNSDGELKVNLETSDIEIGAVELKDGTTDARQAVKVDNETASATPTIALVGGIYKDALDTYADNDATPFHFDVNGQLLTTTAPSAAATTAPTAFRSTAVDETAAVAVKASAGNVYGWNLYNPNSYDVFFKFYNTAQGSTTVGTTAVVETVQVPALGSVVIKEDTPIKSFDTAITVAATKLVADNDSTAIASDVFTHIYYK